MTEIIALGSSRQPHYGSEHRESFPNVQKKLIGPPQLLIPRVPPVLLRQGLVWGPPGTFSPDCLESPTPGACASGDSLFSSVVLADWIWSRGQLKNLRAIPLEMRDDPPCHSNNKSIPFHLGPSEHFSSGNFKADPTATVGASVYRMPLFVIFSSTCLLTFSTIIYCLSQLQQFF